MTTINREGVGISKRKSCKITDVIYSPYFDIIVYNLVSKVACDRVTDFVNEVFNANIRRRHTSDFKAMFFNDVKAVRGTPIRLPPEDFNLKDYLPFTQEDILKKTVDSLPLLLANDAYDKVKSGKKIEGSNAQLLMNLIKHADLTKILTGPSIEDYVSHELEDKIFDWVDSDE